MTCMFCEKVVHVNGLCDSHYHKWNRIGRPVMWNGNGSLDWFGKPHKNLRPVLTDEQRQEFYAGFLLDFHAYCRDNELNYRAEIMRAIKKNHPDMAKMKS